MAPQERKPGLPIPEPEGQGQPLPGEHPVLRGDPRLVPDSSKEKLTAGQERLSTSLPEPGHGGLLEEPVDLDKLDIPPEEKQKIRSSPILMAAVQMASRLINAYFRYQELHPELFPAEEDQPELTPDDWDLTDEEIGAIIQEERDRKKYGNRQVRDDRKA